ncbi:polysaccharide biosynthesis tyrosine autokinase [Microbacterium hydrocarbonoxydans]|uniref:polysaccharide biosynthesis tyrosine autokinase n=1 Tax=Microbacterium hydrocarbonoxydans TaxID=273678 RepID=UPI00203B8FF4|nr:polysaccharide biosynthesis tyrosine autokinase [Microbacterium hydrocarbonoxydans]MCM3778111.1 polysaccharide biosynthesis tyrosine autokinase [Microbacterium hydrocarbonoxydans]
MTVGDYLRAIVRSWLVVVILAILGVAGGYGFAKFTPDTYRSTGAVLVTSDRGDSTSELVQGSAYVQNLVATYVLLARSELVLQPVIDELDLDTTPRALASTITASSPLNSVVIEVSATSGSPRLAQKITEAAIESLATVVSNDVAPQTDGQPTVRLTVIQNADQPRFPFAPSTRNYALFGGLIGLGLGIAFAVLRAFAWQTVRSRADIGRLTSVPVLGEVVETRRGTRLPAAVLKDRLGIEAESVRAVAANLNFLKVDGGLKSLVVTSAASGEAKSSLVIALGLMVAESSRRVLLIDADLRSPSLADYTQLDGGVGLTNVLIGEASLAEAVQEWGAEGLCVLTSGADAPNPSQLLTSQRMTDLLEEARAEFDFIVVDCAPLLAVTDATWLGNQTDGALLTVLYDKTRTHNLEKVVNAASVGGLNLLGAVLTRVPRRGVSRYGVGSYGARTPSEVERLRRRLDPRERSRTTS